MGIYIYICVYAIWWGSARAEGGLCHLQLPNKPEALGLLKGGLKGMSRDDIETV